MSQNKTIVPNTFSESVSNNTELDASVYNSLYRPHTNAIDSGKTVVADCDNNSLSGISEKIQHPLESTRTITVKERVVVGVLYSISRSIIGDIFPIYLGTNRVGSDAACDIVLKEMSVSDYHALITVWKDEDDKYNMNIQDNNSYYGTYIGSEMVDYESRMVHDGDILSFGRHYKLLVRLFNTDTMLYEDIEFEPMAEKMPKKKSKYDDIEDNLVSDFYAPTKKTEDSTRTVLY